MMCDFAATGKPMVFYTYDLEDYRDNLRGFYLDFEAEVPGPLLATSDEVIAALADLDAVAARYRPHMRRSPPSSARWTTARRALAPATASSAASHRAHGTCVGCLADWQAGNTLTVAAVASEAPRGMAGELVPKLGAAAMQP